MRNVIERRLRGMMLSLSYAPIVLNLIGRPVRHIVIVTGSDDSHFRSLQQFLRSAARHEADSDSDLIIYDLGLSGGHREELAVEFPCITVRRFQYESYPEFLNIQTNAGQYAWKPVIVAEVMEEFGAPVVWMDAGNVIVKRLTLLRRLLGTVGFYSPYSQGAISDWTHPGMLKYLQVNSALCGRQNLNGACVAVNPNFRQCRAMITRWRDLALIKDCIAPSGADRTNHRQDQALLTVLAYQMGLAQKVYPMFAGYRIHCDIDEPDQSSDVSSFDIAMHARRG